MTEIISFNHKGKEQNNVAKTLNVLENTTSILKENPSKETVAEIVYEIQNILSEEFKDINWKEQNKISSENTKNFHDRYKTVYAVMPETLELKIPYLSSIMLSLVKTMFEEEMINSLRLRAFYDYGKFLYSDFENCLDELERKYASKIIKINFPGLKEPENLKEEIQNCLQRIAFMDDIQEKENEVTNDMKRIFELDIFLNRFAMDNIREVVKNE